MSYNPTSTYDAIIYRPGGTTAGDVVATWAEVKTFIQASSNGKCIVYVDDSIVSPALVDTVTGITDCLGKVEIRPYVVDSVNFTVLQVEPGATLRDLYRIASMELRCNAQNATPSLDFVLAASGGNLILEEYGALTNASTATTTAISVAGGAVLQITGGQANVFLNNGAVPIFNVVALGLLKIVVFDASFIDANYASGAGRVNFVYDNSTASSFGTPGTPPPLPALTGTYDAVNDDNIWAQKPIDPTTFNAPALNAVPVFNGTEWEATTVPSLYPNPTWTQADWYVDWVAGNDTNDGKTQVTAVRTVMGGVVAKWGTVSPVLAQTTTIHVVSSQPVAAETIVLEPVLAAANILFIIDGTIGRAPVGGGAIATLTAKNRATGAQFALTITGVSFGAKAQLVNATRMNSTCMMEGTGAGAPDQPIAPLVPGVADLFAPAPAEVDTWAVSDHVDVYTLPLLNLMALNVTGGGAGNAPHTTGPGVWLQNIEVPDPIAPSDVSLFTPQCSAYLFIYNCVIDPYFMVGYSGGGFTRIVGCYCLGGELGTDTAVYAGGVNAFGWVIAGAKNSLSIDHLITSGVTVIGECALGAVNLGGDGLFSNEGIVQALDNTIALWGMAPGFENLFGGRFISLFAWATVFPRGAATMLKLNGLTTGSTYSSGTFTDGVAITPAALDAAPSGSIQDVRSGSRFAKYPST